MLEQQKKLKRQLEILGLCINPAIHFTLDISSLAIFFNVEDITIKRDLRCLRSLGIGIHSSGRKGLFLSSFNDLKKIKELMLQYIGLCYSDNVIDRSTSLLIQKKHASALAEMISLQICVDKCLVAEIRYQDHNGSSSVREIRPLLIFHSEGSWRVLSQEGSPVKQFHLDKIASVKVTDRSFERMPVQAFENLFRYSFGSWLGIRTYKVTLRFGKIWAERLKNRRLTEDQTIEELDNGDMIYQATVNDIDEIARWITGLGGGCEVLEPAELRNRVIELAKETLSNYKIDS